MYLRITKFSLALYVATIFNLCYSAFMVGRYYGKMQRPAITEKK